MHVFVLAIRELCVWYLFRCKEIYCYWYCFVIITYTWATLLNPTMLNRNVTWKRQAVSSRQRVVFNKIALCVPPLFIIIMVVGIPF